MIYQTKSLLGARPKNEDEIDIVFNYNNSISGKKKMNYYGIYDGHGGNTMSKYVCERLSKYFINKTSNFDIGKNKKCNKYIVTTYEHMQNKIEQLQLTSRSCGTTALVIMQYEKGGVFSQLKIANLGDCRAVLCTESNVAIPLTKDHKPMAYDENKRITMLNGNITHDRNDDPRINGFSVSRAFGDVEAKPHISHIPELFDYELSTKSNKIIDKFLILACDGVWDVLSNQDAVDFVLFKLDEISSLQTCNSGKNNIANMLGKYAIVKGSQDNISVAIVFF